MIRFIPIVKLSVTLVLTTDYYIYLTDIKGLKQVCPIYMGCLLELGACSHLWYALESVFFQHLTLYFIGVMILLVAQLVTEECMAWKETPYWEKRTMYFPVSGH